MSVSCESVTPQLRLPTYSFLPTTNSPAARSPAATGFSFPRGTARRGRTNWRVGEPPLATPVGRSRPARPGLFEREKRAFGVGQRHNPVGCGRLYQGKRLLARR